jgi:hypothetical protein
VGRAWAADPGRATAAHMSASRRQWLRGLAAWRTPAMHSSPPYSATRPQPTTAAITPPSVRLMHEHINPKNDQAAPLVSDEFFDIVMEVCAWTSALPCSHGGAPHWHMSPAAPCMPAPTCRRRSLVAAAPAPPLFCLPRSTASAWIVRSTTTVTLTTTTLGSRCGSVGAGPERRGVGRFRTLQQGLGLGLHAALVLTPMLTVQRRAASQRLEPMRRRPGSLKQAVIHQLCHVALPQSMGPDSL